MAEITCTNPNITVVNSVKQLITITTLFIYRGFSCELCQSEGRECVPKNSFSRTGSVGHPKSFRVECLQYISEDLEGASPELENLSTKNCLIASQLPKIHRYYESLHFSNFDHIK